MAVAIRPDGVEETTSGLDQVSEKFEETAGSVDNTAGLLDGLTSRIQGSAGVILAGLSVLTAGLLSQVPVVGEAISGLAAIIDALALRIDGVLRPALQPLTQELFDIADAIAGLEGPAGTAVGIVGALAGALGAAQGAIIALNTVVGTSIPNIVALLTGPLGLAITLLVGLIAGLVQAWRTDWGNIRSNTAKEIEFIQGLISGFADFMSGAFETILETLTAFWTEALTVTLRFSNAVVAAMEKLWVRIQIGFETLFALVVAEAKRFANTIVSIMESAVNAAISAIPNFIRSQLGLETVNLGTPFGDIRSRGDIIGAGQRRLSQRDRAIGAREGQRNQLIEDQIADLVAALQNSPVEFEVNLDGQEVARNQERWVGTGAGNQGRLNPI